MNIVFMTLTVWVALSVSIATMHWIFRSGAAPTEDHSVMYKRR